MEDLNITKPWNELEEKKIKALLKDLDPDDRSIFENWCSSPQNLLNEIGHKNVEFIRNIWQDRNTSKIINTIHKKFILKLTPYNPPTEDIFNRILKILYKYLFYKWSNEEYQKRTQVLINDFLFSFSDFWEIPIFKKWFETKENLIDEFGKNLAGDLISSLIYTEIIFPVQFWFARIARPSKIIFPPEIENKYDISLDGIYINCKAIVEKLRYHIPGYDVILKRKIQYSVYFYLINGIMASFLIIFFFFLNINIHLAFRYLLIWIILINSLNLAIPFKINKNFYFKIFIITNLANTLFLLVNLYSIFLNFTSFKDYLLLLYVLNWIIEINSITFIILSNYHYKKKGEKVDYDTTVLLFSGCILTFIILINILIFRNSDEIMIISLICLLIFFNIIEIIWIAKPNLNTIYNPEHWIKNKLINPFKLYEKLGIFKNFTSILAEITNLNVNEVIKKIDKSKSIGYNYFLFGIEFKQAINRVFELFVTHEKNLEDILLQCPEDKECSVLTNEMKKIEKNVSNNIHMPDINFRKLGLLVYEKLPKDIRISLMRAEEGQFAYKLCNLDYYGHFVLELAISLENLLKILMKNFIDKISIQEDLNYLFNETRLKEDMPIIKMIRFGVENFYIGAILTLLQKTCEYPKNCKTRNALSKFLKDFWPINVTFLKELSELTEFRNDAAHVAGAIIKSKSYFKFRDLVFKIMNQLKVDLSDFNISDVSYVKKEKINLN